MRDCGNLEFLRGRLKSSLTGDGIRDDFGARDRSLRKKQCASPLSVKFKSSPTKILYLRNTTKVNI